MKRCCIMLMFCLLMILPTQLVGCTSNQLEFQWNLRGSWVTPTGEIKGNTTFSMNGNVPKEFEGLEPKDIELDIVWSDTSLFVNMGLQTHAGYSNCIERNNYPFHIASRVWYYDSARNKPGSMPCVIYPDDECVVFYHEDSNLYLIASTDLNVDLEIWLDFYKEIPVI